MSKKRSGYNVIELLIAITAIALITAIGYKGVNILINNIKAEQLISQLKQIEVGMANYYADTGTYPTKLSLLVKKSTLSDTITTEEADQFDAISNAFYGSGNGDTVVTEYWAGPYVNGMSLQGDCIKSVVGYEICLGGIFDDTSVKQLYKTTYVNTDGGLSVKQDASANRFYHVVSINGVETEMAIKVFESLNRRSIETKPSDSDTALTVTQINKNMIESNKDKIGVGTSTMHEQTKTIVYRYTDAY